jgi:hypothetical protein
VFADVETRPSQRLPQSTHLEERDDSHAIHLQNESRTEPRNSHARPDYMNRGVSPSGLVDPRETAIEPIRSDPDNTRLNR